MTPKTPVVVLARVLMAGMFLLAGISKFRSLDGTAAYIEAVGGLPLAWVLAPTVATFEVLAGLALIVGWQARWTALALAFFTLAATLLFHAFWAEPADQAFTQQLLFTKNLAIVGGLLMIFSLGAGPGSVDARQGR